MRKQAFPIVAIVVAVITLLAPSAALAGELPSESTARTADLAVVNDALQHDQVVAALHANGLTPEQAEARVAQLSSQDLSRLADNLEQVQVAGQAPDYIWIMVAALLIVAIVAVA